MYETNNTATASFETVCDHLLTEIYKSGATDIYDFAANLYGTDNSNFALVRPAALHLVKEKLAVYTDDQHTGLAVSNYGRYWILQGGYISFLKEEHETKEHLTDKNAPGKQHSKEELLEARLKLTHYRLIGFWLIIILSILGFIFSLVNFYLLVKGKN